METIQIKTRYTQKVIFEYKAENATLKDAVEEAVRQGINLSFVEIMWFGTTSLVKSNQNSDIRFEISPLRGICFGKTDLPMDTLLDVTMTNCLLPMS